MPEAICAPFAFQYKRILCETMLGHEELNERTGVKIQVAAPTSMVLDLSSGKLPMIGLRKTFPRSAAAEAAWFLQGSKDVSFIRKYAPLWDDFVEDDGQTIEAAYGYRWRSHFGRDQIAEAISALKANPSDRRIMVSAWDPGMDGLGVPSKNVPCPAIFTLSITNGKLSSTLLIRSSDVFVGLPYDVMCQSFLMAAIAQQLDVKLGFLQISIAHPHIYEPHVEQARDAFQKREGFPEMSLPLWTVDDIVLNPDDYVEQVAIEAKAIKHMPEYHCRPAIVV